MKDLNMDFIDGLPQLDKYNYLMVYMVCLNKYNHFNILKHLYMAYKVATIFIRDIV